MSGKALIGLLLVAIVSTGCFTHRYATSPEAERGDEVYRQWHSHWLFGVISKDEVDLEQLCPSGNYAIEDKHTFVNQLLGALTMGIWIPTTVTVRCADGSAQLELDVDEDLARSIVTEPGFLSIVEDLYPERLAHAEFALQQLELAGERASTTGSSAAGH